MLTEWILVGVQCSLISIVIVDARETTYNLYVYQNVYCQGLPIVTGDGCRYTDSVKYPVNDNTEYVLVITTPVYCNGR